MRSFIGDHYFIVGCLGRCYNTRFRNQWKEKTGFEPTTKEKQFMNLDIQILKNSARSVDEKLISNHRTNVYLYQTSPKWDGTKFVLNDCPSKSCNRSQILLPSSVMRGGVISKSAVVRLSRRVLKPARRNCFLVFTARGVQYIHTHTLRLFLSLRKLEM